MKNKFNIIVAIADDNAIGYGGDLLWHIHEDMVYFKQTTKYHPVLMGRKTWESLQVKPLPKRKNIILTQNKEKLKEDIGKILLEKRRKIAEKNSENAEKDNTIINNNLQTIDNKDLFSDIEIITNLEEVNNLPQYDNEVFVIGGGSIYREMLELCDRLYITRVYHSYAKADTFFPQIDLNEWSIESRSEKQTDEESNLQFQFFVLKRKDKK